ncbi:MAG TPA: sigma-70 family RNA polymerase sigma factor [Mycobacteriales bacterium]|jgi:RNA polymerase sigma factor (sigma-70 family)|nr:sigma-70 family RNA polymerase sigma factor [Mycobacteriales bacterium]
MLDQTAPGDLLVAARAGDRRAWDELVSRHTGLLWSVTRSFRLSRTAAEDVVQTVWLRLLERGGTIRDPAAVTAWLATTTRRECLAVLRRSGDTLGEDAMPEPVDRRSPEDESLRMARDRTLWTAFARLPERDALLLRLLTDGLRYREVAAVLGVPLGSIGPTRARALDRLRAELGRVALRDLADAI